MKEFLENQYKNLFLWTPFVMAFGGALYFSLDYEPNFHFPIIIAILSALIIYKNKNTFLRALMLFVFGFFYSMAFTQIINTPQMKYDSDMIYIDSHVSDIDFTTESTRLFIKVPANKINYALPENKNAILRISMTNDIDVNIGDKISGYAKIFHPSPKYAPDSFDFARWSYFNKISGTGFFVDYELNKTTDNTQNIRTFIHNRTKSNLSDALVLGYKKSVPENESEIWKSVGLGHIWSISGFHMALVNTWLFIFFYLIFRSIPYITRRIPAKYPSVICAWFGLLIYLYISGMGIATSRAFLMLTLVSIAILFNRNVFSLRNASLAFLILFLINPFFVMHAGFQLSFAAVFGLLWFFQDSKYIKRNFINRVFHICYATFMTAFIAMMFTLPFTIAHFGYLPIYSLLGNLIILPIFSFAIMPCIMIGTIIAIFGDHFLLDITHNIYDFALNIANQINELPFATVQMPHLSNAALLLCVFGLMCIILIRKSEPEKFINYIFGGVFIVLASIIYISTPRPLFYATDDHKLVGFIYDNHIKFNKSKSAEHYFAFDTWYKFNNEPTPDKNTRIKCDHGLCIYKSPKWNLAYMQNFTTIMDNIDKICNDKSINYIVATFDIKSENCNAKILNDGILIYPSGHVVNFSNHRPWHIQH